MLDTKVTQAVGLDVVAGNQFGFAPPVTINFGAEWEAIDGLTIDGQVAFSGGYFGDVVNDAGFTGGNYATADFGIAYDFGPVTARAFVQNAFDELAFLSRTGDDNARLTRPRTFGVTLSSAF